MARGVPDAPGFEFWHIQVDRLGDRAPIPVLASTPDAITEALSAYPDHQFAVRPAPGKWSAAEVMGHLVDIEFVFGYRVRTILCDVEPTFGGIDQDRWVSQQRWHDVAPAEIARRFSLIRAVNVAWWESVPPDALARTGRHSEAGVDLSLDLMLRVLAGHDLYHLDQMHRALTAG